MRHAENWRMDDNRLGAILLEGGIVDEKGLDRCLAIQALTGSTRPIGQILVEQGLLDESMLERLLVLQKVRIQSQRPKVVPEDLACASLMAAALANGASEVVISEGRTARIRVGASWRPLTDDVLSGPEVWDFVREAMGPEVLERLADQHFVVRPWQIDGVGRGSAAAFRQFDGVAVRVTFVDELIAAPEQLGVPGAVVDSIAAGKGLILCIGERGIGRGDLLASLAQLAAKDPAHYVVVVDDEPAELPADGAMVVRRRYGIDPAARAQVLRNVVGEDPDAIVIADVGSYETFELALRAAEGGRLVIAHIDAQNVVSALTRILNFYPIYELPRVRASLAAVLRIALLRLLLPDAEHSGTVAATEMLVVGEAAREVIRDGELGDVGLLLRAEGERSGHSLDRSMLELLTAGRVRIEDVFMRAEEKAWLLEQTRDLQKEAR
jgi:twitching motility protein PilT